MLINVDLHSHSTYSGAVGTIDLSTVDQTVPKKGIQIVGSGDIQFPKWKDVLQKQLNEWADGLFELNGGSQTKFLLQTEVIFTAQIGKGRKLAHTVLLFHSFDQVNSFQKLLEKWNVKFKSVGRPFIVCKDNHDIAQKIHKILDLGDFVEAFPAHIMTPDGVYGSNNPVNYFEDFYGDVVERIRAIETGLSADPAVLALIPELDDKTFLSNSDAHSMALNRIGREFTTLKVADINYPDIISAIRTNAVERTIEFNPTEGRYFLTGHRSKRNFHKQKKQKVKPLVKNYHDDDEYCYFSPRHAPVGNICPICHSPLTVGVLQRAFTLSRAQGASERSLTDYPKNSSREFLHIIPLVEVIAAALKVKSPNAKSVLKLYDIIIKEFENECNMWMQSGHLIKDRLQKKVSESLVNQILEVQRGNFMFQPMGYDGTYGSLVIGETADFLDVSCIHFKGD